MSKAEIMEALPALSEEERNEILSFLLGLEEAHGPTDQEKNILNEAQARYDSDLKPGRPWPEVEARLRKR
jgi:DNA-binding transcriptional ArsR family regulator